MNYRLALLIAPLFCSNILFGDDLSDLKKMAALQQAAISNLEKKIQILETQLSESNLKNKSFEIELKNFVNKGQILETGITGVVAQVNGLINGSTRVSSITFQNGTRIIQDQGISIFPVNERNNTSSPYYFHFGNALEAWKSPYNGENQVIWSWK